MQESLIFDLCRIHLMKMQALNAKNFDDYNKMATLYQKTLTTANLEPKKKDNLSKELETWGTLTGIPVLSEYQSRFGANLVFKVADKNHGGYPSNSATLITDKIIQIMPLDAIESSNSDSNRAESGNNRYV